MTTTRHPGCTMIACDRRPWRGIIAPRRWAGRTGLERTAVELARDSSFDEPDVPRVAQG